MCNRFYVVKTGSSFYFIFVAFSEIISVYVFKNYKFAFGLYRCFKVSCRFFIN